MPGQDEGVEAFFAKGCCTRIPSIDEHSAEEVDRSDQLVGPSANLRLKRKVEVSARVTQKLQSRHIKKELAMLKNNKK